MAEDTSRLTVEAAEVFYRELGCKKPSQAYNKLVRLRREGTGPRYTKTGGLTSPVVYRDSEIKKWLEERTYSNPAEERARRAEADSK